METIRRFNPETEFYLEEGCHIVEIHNVAEDESCSIARSRVEPGKTTQLHGVRNTIERYVILEGEGFVEIGGGPPAPLRSMDFVFIPPGVSQRITNTGTSDLVFLAVCTPRFKQESYVNMERDKTDN